VTEPAGPFPAFGNEPTRFVLRQQQTDDGENEIISPFRQRMHDDTRLRKLSPKTQAGYCRAVHSFAGFTARSPDTVSKTVRQSPVLWRCIRAHHYAWLYKL